MKVSGSFPLVGAKILFDIIGASSSEFCVRAEIEFLESSFSNIEAWPE